MSLCLECKVFGKSIKIARTRQRRRTDQWLFEQQILSPNYILRLRYDTGLFTCAKKDSYVSKTGACLPLSTSIVLNVPASQTSHHWANSAALVDLWISESKLGHEGVLESH